MNLYIIVEGEQTEMKVYPEWLHLLAPQLERVDDAWGIKTDSNSYYLFSAGGIPSIFNHVSNAVADINEINASSDAKYDYLVVGPGLYGAVFAHEAKKKGKSVLVIDKRPHIAGNVYTEDVEKIHVHKYGAHIFHTNNKKVWDYITRFAEFNRFTNSPVANYKGELYSLPFNMYTFNKMWNVTTPQEAAAKIVKIIDTVEPEPELVAKYEERYQQFKQIYPACKPLFDIIK